MAQVSVAPAGSTLITRIEESSDWQTCGSCGNDDGSGARASYSMTRGITSPSTDGSSTEYRIGGGHPYKNAYWYIEHSDAAWTPVVYLKYEFDLYIPRASANAPQAIEFECQQKARGRVYNFAWQADYASHEWRTFNYVTRVWSNSGLSFSGFEPDTWHHIVAEFHTENGKTVHDALTVNGVRHVFGIHHPSRSTSAGHYLTNAFQLDLNGNAKAYKVFVDNMRITYK
jgi:hypothetical protein